MASRILFDNPLATLSIDDARGIVTLVRNDAPLDLAVVEKTTDELASILPLRERAHLALLLDMRRAPLAGPDAEKRLSEFAVSLQRGFLATTTVLATAVGRLQAARMRRERGLAPEIATDPEEARRHLEDVVRHHRASLTRGRIAKA